MRRGGYFGRGVCPAEGQMGRLQGGTPGGFPAAHPPVSGVAVEAVLQRFAGIGLADLKDIQEPFSGYTYLESTDAFYNTTSDYAPGYFICTGGEVNLEEEYARLYGSTAGLFPAKPF